MPLSINLIKEISLADSDPIYSGYGNKPPLEDGYGFDALDVDPKVYNYLVQDGVIGAVIQKRKLAVTSREIAYEGDSDSIDLIKKATKHLPIDEICSSLLDANLKGFAVMLVTWRFDEELKLNIPDLSFIPQHRINFTPKSSRTPEDALIYKGYEVRLLTRNNPRVGEIIPQMRAIIFSAYYGVKNLEIPQGKGFASILWTFKVIRDEIKKQIVIHGDHYASPVPVAETEGSMSDRDLDELEDVLDNLTQGAYAILPEGAKLSFMEAGSSGGDFYLRSYQHFGNEIAKVVLGETGTTDQSGGGGSRARDEVGNSVRLELVKADADMLHQALQPLLNWIVELNSPSLIAPISYRIFPKDELGQAEIDKVRKENQKATSDIYRTLIELGYRPSSEQLEKDFPGWGDSAPPIESESSEEQGSEFALLERFIPKEGRTLSYQEFREISNISEETLDEAAQQWARRIRRSEFKPFANIINADFP